ncbi:hypothetical protein [Cryobacterium arcticum]|uniref:Uncharacterized protein n=1 Tax=Cryobacterium arcticum TaxID=670052 RepID=A0A318A3W0_9MICO|nr:hypothetical protein [Cryobacterium arcticum]PXA72037.1 hypothetical protein CTB96_03790 [Cryobacterium arcticum]
MVIERKFLVANVALSVSALALLVATGLLVTSLVIGAGTTAGERLSQTGTGLTIAFVVIVAVLTTWTIRLRRIAD